MRKTRDLLWLVFTLFVASVCVGQGIGGNGTLNIVNVSLLPATVGAPYSVGLVAKGGTPPYKWFAVSESQQNGLDGLSIQSPQPGSYVFAGTPLKAGVFTFLLVVNDAAHRVDHRTMTLSVAAAAAPPTPAPPRSYVNTTWTPPTGTTANVACSGNPANDGVAFQNAVNAALPNSTIVLQAGCTYSGNFVLPQKSNPNQQWIYIESSGLAALPAPGTRVGPSNAPNMPKVVTPNVNNAIAVVPGAGFYRLVGIELTSNSNQGCNLQNNPPVNCFTYYLASSTNGVPSDALAQSIIYDRVYAHGSPTQDVIHAIDLDGVNVAVVDSYISEIHGSHYDAQAILAYYSPGPFKIVNNFLSATTEDVMFGGAGGYNNPYVPSDIEIRKNTFFKPVAWDSCGTGGTVPPGALLANGTACPSGPINQWIEKNNLELKNAQRAIITGNTMQNTWLSAQTGYSFLLTIRTSQSGNNAVVDDIDFESNILENVDAGVSTLEQDDQCSAQDGYPDCTNPGESKRVRIANNLLLLSSSKDTYQHAGWKIDGGNATHPGFTDFVLQHNTVLMADNSTLWAAVEFTLPQMPWDCTPPGGFSATHDGWVLDNALTQQPDGDCGLVTSLGVAGLTDYMGDPSPLAPRFYGNAIFAPGRVNTYPADNLVSTTPFTWVNPALGDYQLLTPNDTDTTDGKVSGIDWATLQAAQN